LATFAHFEASKADYVVRRAEVLGGRDFCGGEQHSAGVKRAQRATFPIRGILFERSERSERSELCRATPAEQRSGVGAQRRPPQHERRPSAFGCHATVPGSI
jgi:hypothetical protein